MVRYKVIAYKVSRYVYNDVDAESEDEAADKVLEHMVFPDDEMLDSWCVDEVKEEWA